jgi:hypothetical protein
VVPDEPVLVGVLVCVVDVLVGAVPVGAAVVAGAAGAL